MSTSVYDKYELVVGLEVHTQLLTRSKAYASDSAEYGGAPNTHVSPVSLGLPGALPVFNEKVVEFAVKLGLALGSEIRHENQFARKNYFYADLPKGYQITQHTTPICDGGLVMIKDDEGKEKQISLERIHWEEDAGKSMHDQDPFDSLIDLNRAGVPLLEIVSRPDMRSAKEAYNYLTEIRKLVRHLDICDGNMEEGSLRCDANISVRLRGDQELGRKVEVKNMNSIRNVQRAIEYEFTRQVDAIENGETIAQETRNFDALSGKTFSMRSKEMAHDYRYFPEPDLPPVFVTQEYIEQVRAMMPPLPDALFRRYTGELKLSEYDAMVLTESKWDTLYFEEMIRHTKHVKAAANWMMGQIKSYMNEQGVTIREFPLKPQTIAALINIIDEGKISNTAASQQVFPALIRDASASPLEIAQQLNLIQESNSGVIEQIVDDVLNSFPDEVAKYKAGKTNLLQMFVGQVMKASKGKADPKVTTEIVRNKLGA